MRVTQISIDRTDVERLQRAMDALEELHDAVVEPIGSEHVRHCLCAEAAAWRATRPTLQRLRAEMGMRGRLLDRV
jgi:hypothetical protein